MWFSLIFDSGYLFGEELCMNSGLCYFIKKLYVIAFSITSIKLKFLILFKKFYVILFKYKKP